jgi:dipeptidyl aminopeptidase/acylaminoacyl peptidase
LRVPSFDDEMVPVFVYRPTGPSRGSTVVYLHGGPALAQMCTWNPEIASLAAEGHTVIVPNVRGSAAYGKRWYALDDRNLRFDAVRDLGAIHDWLKTYGADTDRVALWGTSYGGFLVLAGLAFQPERWAAGVDISGIASMTTYLESTAAWRYAIRAREYGYLDTDREFLESVSPLNRVDDIRAPLTVVHGANDPRVPQSQAVDITAGLTGRGVDCELLTYSDEGHGIEKRHNQLDAYSRAISRLGEQLGSASRQAHQAGQEVRADRQGSEDRGQSPHRPPAGRREAPGARGGRRSGFDR